MELYKRIYDEILAYEGDYAKCNRKADREVGKIVAPLLERLDGAQREELCEAVGQIVQTAEHAGFLNGIRFAMSAMKELS